MLQLLSCDGGKWAAGCVPTTCAPWGPQSTGLVQQLTQRCPKARLSRSRIWGLSWVPHASCPQTGPLRDGSVPGRGVSLILGRGRRWLPPPHTGSPPPWLWHRYGNRQRLPRPTAKPTQLSMYCSLLFHLGLSSPLPPLCRSGPRTHAMLVLASGALGASAWAWSHQQCPLRVSFMSFKGKLGRLLIGNRAGPCPGTQALPRPLGPLPALSISSDCLRVSLPANSLFPAGDIWAPGPGTCSCFDCDVVANSPVLL